MSSLWDQFENFGSTLLPLWMRSQELVSDKQISKKFNKSLLGWIMQIWMFYSSEAHFLLYKSTSYQVF